MSLRLPCRASRWSYEVGPDTEAQLFTWAGRVYQMDFNRLIPLKWPTVQETLDSGSKVIPADHKRDVFVGIEKNGSIFFHAENEKSFVDLMCANIVKNVIITTCRRAYRVVPELPPLQSFLKDKLPRNEEAIDLFLDEGAFLTRSQDGSYSLYYPELQRHFSDSQVELLGTLVDTYGPSAFCQGTYYVVAGQKSLIRFFVQRSGGLFEMTKIEVHLNDARIRRLLPEASQSRLVLEVELSSIGERELMAASVYTMEVQPIKILNQC